MVLQRNARTKCVPDDYRYLNNIKIQGLQLLNHELLSKLVINTIHITRSIANKFAVMHIL